MFSSSTVLITLNSYCHSGDVSDLSLTFSVDDDFLGKLITQELRPGGKAIPVTNENKLGFLILFSL